MAAVNQCTSSQASARILNLNLRSNAKDGRNVTSLQMRKEEGALNALQLNSFWKGSLERKTASKAIFVVTAAGSPSSSSSASPSHDPPTVADTKAKFLRSYKRPIPALYNNVIQELLVQQHLVRYNGGYAYDPVFALGFVTVFDQLMDGFLYPDEAEKIFKAYIGALDEDPEQYRRDAAAFEAWAQGSDASVLLGFRDAEGPIPEALQAIAARTAPSPDGQPGPATSSFYYSRFFAIGLFRLLELSQSSDPATLDKLCTSLGVPKMSVERDLDIYRGLLNKLTQAKDLLQDFLAREKVKAEEREKEKAQAKAE